MGDPGVACIVAAVPTLFGAGDGPGTLSWGVLGTNAAEERSGRTGRSGVRRGVGCPTRFRERSRMNGALVGTAFLHTTKASQPRLESRLGT